MKIDFKKQIAGYSAHHGTFELVDVPTLQFLMIDGHGDPNTSASYRDAVQTLYPVAYGLKFLSRNELGRDHGVMPLEALWWAEDMASFTVARDRSLWSWTVMIMVPEWITGEHFTATLDTVRRKGSAPALDTLRLESLDEGQAVQTLHIGPYDDEGPVLEAMHSEFLPAHALELTGKHHEIYLSDARRTAPRSSGRSCVNRLSPWADRRRRSRDPDIYPPLAAPRRSVARDPVGGDLDSCRDRAQQRGP